MVNQSLLTYRELQRRKMVYRTKKGTNGEALCHLCNERPGAQMHEIINRNQTQGAARELSFTETLCSWLCQTCHEKAATRVNEERLWRRNIETYGVDVVLKDIRSLIKAMGHAPIIYLPEGVWQLL